jgi:hypothetical protein
VNSSNKSLLVSDSEQKRSKLVALLLTKSGEESILMLPRYLADPVQGEPQLFSKLRRGMRSKLGQLERRLSFFHIGVIHL